MPKLRRVWWQVVCSLWFFPSMMVAVAIVLALGLVELDARLDFPLADLWPRCSAQAAPAEC